MSTASGADYATTNAPRVRLEIPQFPFAPPPGSESSPDLLAFKEKVESGQASTIPIQKYIHGCVWLFRHYESTQPPMHTPSWRWTRLIKSHDFFRNHFDIDVSECIDRHIKHWLPQSNHPTADILCLDPERFEVLFGREWDRVQVGYGETPLEAAYELAMKKPLKMPPHLRYRGRFPLFTSMAGYLQKMYGSKPIFIPCRCAGELMGVSHQTIADYIGNLMGKRVMRLVAKDYYDKENPKNSRARRVPVTFRTGHPMSLSRTAQQIHL